MAYSKIDQFSDREIKLARYAKALGHPARIAIVELLQAKDSCICDTIVNELPLSQSTVSQHLKELKSAGLIEGEVDGPRVCYCLKLKEWKKVKIFLESLINKVVKYKY